MTFTFLLFLFYFVIDFFSFDIIKKKCQIRNNEHLRDLLLFFFSRTENIAKGLSKKKKILYPTVMQCRLPQFELWTKNIKVEHAPFVNVATLLWRHWKFVMCRRSTKILFYMHCFALPFNSICDGIVIKQWPVLNILLYEECLQEWLLKGKWPYYCSRTRKSPKTCTFNPSRPPTNISQATHFVFRIITTGPSIPFGCSSFGTV